MKGLILAAGLGTRLGGLTASLPKCMLPIDGQPLVERLVRWLRRHGIEEIAVNLHHVPQTITNHLGDGSRLGVRITYSYEESLLGTAGAIRRLAPFFDDDFVVVYGDGYTNLNLSRLLQRHAARRQASEPHLTMTLYRVPNPSACGLAELDGVGRVSRFVEKPPPSEVFTDLASAGIMICERAMLDLIPEQPPSDFGRDVLPEALRRGVPIYGEPLAPDEFLIDIGTPESYERARILARAQDEADRKPKLICNSSTSGAHTGYNL